MGLFSPGTKFGLAAQVNKLATLAAGEGDALQVEIQGGQQQGFMLGVDIEGVGHGKI